MPPAPMINHVAMDELFAERPWQWGLRGDPHLWDEMKAELRGVAAPADPGELRAIVEQAFERLSGRPISHPEPFHVARLDHGGMSGGHVQPLWWREKGVPYLLDRHAQLVHGQPSRLPPPPAWLKRTPQRGSEPT